MCARTHNLDDLDVSILRELHTNTPKFNVRESFSDVARALGVDEETVRRRVKRAKALGFLPRWKLMVNPRLVGLEAAHFYAECGEVEKAKAIPQLELLDGIVYLVDFQGGGLRALLYYEDNESLERRLRLVSSICGSPQVTTWKSEFPRPSVRMKGVDWHILDAMKEDARRDPDAVAKSLGVSVRTVQRRLSIMNEGRAMYLVGPPDIERVGGLVCNFLVFCPDAQKKKAADSVVLSTLGRIGSSDTSGEHYSIFGVACENHTEAEKVKEKFRAMDGVRSVRMDVMRNFITVQKWLSGEVRKRSRA